MRVIARIPDVSERTLPAPRGGEEPIAPRRARAPRSRGLLRRVSDACPTWPVAALAVVAVMAWLLASWNDHARLERQRSELRLARETAAGTECAAPDPAAGGAVVR